MARQRIARGAGVELTIDAVGLIDLYDEDPELLPLVAAHVGHVFVVSQILAEVDGFTREAAETVGIEVIDPTDEQLDEASGGSARVSFEGPLYLVVADTAGSSASPPTRLSETTTGRPGLSESWRHVVRGSAYFLQR